MNIKEDIIQKEMKRKLKLFGYIVRMDDSRKIKSVMLGIIMDGTNRKGRPCREWLDDIKEWCQKDIHLLNEVAKERNKWRWTVKCSLDTYGGAVCPWIMMMMKERNKWRWTVKCSLDTYGLSAHG